MSRTPVRIPCPEARAEGRIHFTHNGTKYSLPYDTNLAGPDGCSIHIWLGKHSNISGLALAARKEADNYRDIVECTYSNGGPTSYWANQDLK